MVVQRMTFFRVLNPQKDFNSIKALYETLRATAQKNGKPYVLSLTAKPTIPNTPGDQGYNFVAISQFKDEEDHLFYHEDCDAHKILKNSLGSMVEKPPLSVWVEL